MNHQAAVLGNIDTIMVLHSANKLFWIPSANSILMIEASVTAEKNWNGVNTKTEEQQFLSF